MKQVHIKMMKGNYFKEREQLFKNRK